MEISNPLYQLHPHYVSTYSERAQPQLNWALEFMNKMDLKGLARIVDVGCREGSITMELARRFPGAHIIGIDSSISFLEVANENLAKHVIPNLEFKLIDPVQMDFMGKIDAITSFSFFHWVADKLPLLKAIRRSLHKGGKAYLSFFADHQREKFDNCLREVIQYEKWQPYFSEAFQEVKEIRTHQFATLVNKAGLILNKLEFVKIHDIFTSQDQFKEWFTTWSIYLKYIPGELHDTFLSDVLEKYLENHPLDSEGRIHRYDYITEVELLNVL